MCTESRSVSVYFVGLCFVQPLEHLLNKFICESVLTDKFKVSWESVKKKAMLMTFITIIKNKNIFLCPNEFGFIYRKSPIG